MAAAGATVSLSEIASFAEVTPAAVSNWRRRYDDFPRPVTTEGQESFLATDVARWLDQRKIPQNLLGENETEGSTYGDRFRRNAGMIRAHNVGETPDISQMVWRQLGRLRGVLSFDALSDLTLTLLYIRGNNPQAWKPVVERAYAGPREVEWAISDALSADGWLRDLPSSLAGAIGQAADSRHLMSIIQAIDSIDPGGHEIRPAIAAGFSSLLARFAAVEGRKGGEFYTPESIANLVVQLLAPSPTDRIFDPSCGTGELLAAAVDDVHGRSGSAEMSVAGFSFTNRSCRLAGMNLRLRGVGARIWPDATTALRAGRPDHRYDVVMANPPFNMAHWIHDSGMLGHWRYGSPPEHNANFAWLQYVISSLDRGGRAAVIMPNGAGSSENKQERDIRAAMLEDGAVSAIIALPSHLFVSTAIPVTVWLLQHPDAGRRDEVLFIDATEMGTNYERSRRTLTDGDIDKIVQVYTNWHDRAVTGAPGFAASADLSRIRKARYRLNPREYVVPPAMTLDRTEAVGTVNQLRQTLHRLQQQAAQIDAVVDQQLKRIQL